MTAGDQTRDFTWIGDAVTALLSLGRRPELGGQIFNVCTGHETSLRRAVELLDKVSGRPVRADYVCAPLPGERAVSRVGQSLLSPRCYRVQTQDHPRGRAQAALRLELPAMLGRAPRSGMSCCRNITLLRSGFRGWLVIEAAVGHAPTWPNPNIRSYGAGSLLSPHDGPRDPGEVPTTELGDVSLTLLL